MGCFMQAKISLLEWLQYSGKKDGETALLFSIFLSKEHLYHSILNTSPNFHILLLSLGKHARAEC